MVVSVNATGAKLVLTDLLRTRCLVSILVSLSASVYLHLRFCLRVHQGLTSLMTLEHRKFTFCKYTMQYTVLVLFCVLRDAVWSPISLMCLLKAAPRWTDNKKRGGGRDKKRSYSINVTHTRTALCGGFQGMRGKRGRMWWVRNRLEEDKQDRKRKGLFFNILSM